MDLLGAVAQEALEITDEPVDVAFARRLQNNVLVVIIPVRREREQEELYYFLSCRNKRFTTSRVIVISKDCLTAQMVKLDILHGIVVESLKECP